MEGKAGSRAGSILSYGLVVMTLTHTHVFSRIYTASILISLVGPIILLVGIKETEG